MKLEFFGGARTVTGSQHLLSVNGVRILMECGLFQGPRKESYDRNQRFCFDPASVDVLVLSHAHIDHSGNVPNFVKNGFRGRIFATPATVDLCQIMLRDSAVLQERDVVWANKIRSRQRQPPVEPLYTMADVDATMELFETVPYGEPREIAPGVQVTFRDAGHILGSAGILFEIQERGSIRRIGFSGDIGRRSVPILRDPDVLRDVELLIMESTYGNRDHEPIEDVEDQLAQTLSAVAQRGGKVIIPAFAVGRTQTIVYALHKLFNQNRLPDLPIYVDSPLATRATEVFRKYPECFDRETQRVFLESEQDPFGFGRLRYVGDVDESKELNGLTFPHIIISASGMAEGGRVLHHLRNNVGNPKALVLLVGHAAEHTLARRLMDGAEVVKIFGEEFRVRCEVKTMRAFSGHADRGELMNYVGFTPPEVLKRIYLVHGEPGQAEPLQVALRRKGYGEVHFPAPQQAYDV